MKIEIIKSSAPPPLAQYNECFRAGPWVFAAGQLASDFANGVAPEARRNLQFPYYGSDIKLQTRYVLENLTRTFEAAGGSLDNVVKAQVFLTDLSNFNGFDEVWRSYFEVPPPRTTIGVSGLLVPGTLVEIDLVGYVADQDIERQVVKSAAPQPLANYSEAFTIGNLVFAAGQLASDFKTGVPPEVAIEPSFPYYGSAIKRQTRFILENLKHTFEAAGSSLDEVLKAQVFLKNRNDFNDFDEVWKEFFIEPPARTTVGTTGLLVDGTLVEIDLIGHLPGRGSKREAVRSTNPQPLVNYTEAFRAGELVFAAGQVATDFKTGIAKEAAVNPAFPYYGCAIEKQTRYILNNLRKTFEAAGSSLDQVVKAQVFLTDLDDFWAFDQVWKEVFKNPPPRTTIGIPGLLLDDGRIEIDLIGIIGN
jgi:enamine deaminase RidA (YjgF/YER057c/UK114 family)